MNRIAKIIIAIAFASPLFPAVVYVSGLPEYAGPDFSLIGRKAPIHYRVRVELPSAEPAFTATAIERTANKTKSPRYRPLPAAKREVCELKTLEQGAMPGHPFYVACVWL